MGFTNNTYLKGAVGDNSMLTRESMPDGLDEAIAEADQIIYSYTEIPPPDDPAEANAMLRNIANSLVIWFFTGSQDEISEQEYNRRQKNYQDAMNTLREIKAGNITLEHDSDPDITLPFIGSTNRITEMF